MVIFTADIDDELHSRIKDAIKEDAILMRRMATEAFEMWLKAREKQKEKSQKVEG